MKANVSRPVLLPSQSFPSLLFWIYLRSLELLSLSLSLSVCVLDASRLMLTCFLVDVYDEPEEEMLTGDQAADDRIAEQFRRDFLDAIQSRRRVRATRTTKTDKVEAPKGPKLGGSRSARAAMREMQGKTGQK